MSTSSILKRFAAGITRLLFFVFVCALGFGLWRNDPLEATNDYFRLSRIVAAFDRNAESPTLRYTYVAEHRDESDVIRMRNEAREVNDGRCEQLLRTNPPPSCGTWGCDPPVCTMGRSWVDDATSYVDARDAALADATSAWARSFTLAAATSGALALSIVLVVWLISGFTSRQTRDPS